MLFSLLGLTKFKIEGRGDVEKLTSLPIVGDVPLTDEKQALLQCLRIRIL